MTTQDPEGAWVASKDGRVIYDDASKDDSLLRVSGDFENDEQRISYAKQIVDKLNAAPAQQAEPVEPVAKVIATAPKRIWLDLGFEPADEDITFDQLFEVTWSQDNATGWGIEYVRADLVAPPQRTMVPLTEEEILAAVGWERAAMYMKLTPNFPVDEAKKETLTNARAVEKASWEKNHGQA